MTKPTKNTPGAASQQFSVIVRLGDLVDSAEVLKELAMEKPNGKSPPAAISMALATVMTHAYPHLKNFDKVLTELREKYREPALDSESKPVPGKFKVTPENQKAFDVEYAALLDTEIPLPIGKLPLSSLEGAGLALTGQVIYLLDWLIKGDVAPAFVQPDPPQEV